MSQRVGFWKARLRDATGRLHQRSIYSYTEAQYWSLATSLRAQGFTVESLVWKKPSLWSWQGARVRKQRVAVLEAVQRLVQIGKPPASALAHVIEGFEEDPGIRMRLEPARDEVRQSGSLAKGLELTGLMTPPVLAMLQAGEGSSSMAPALDAALRYLHRQQEVARATAWKVGIIAAELLTTLSISLFVHQDGRAMIVDAIEKMGLEDTGALMAQLDIALALNSAVLYVGGGITLAVSALVALYASADYKLRQKLDPVMFQLPYFKPLVEDLSFGVSFGVAARVLQSGGHSDKAVQIAKNAAQVPVVRRYFEKVTKDLSKGADIGRAFYSPLLKYHETVSLTSFSSLKQLGNILATLSEVRERSLGANVNKIVAVASGFMVVASIVAGWVLYQGYTITTSALGQQLQQAQ